MPSWRRLQSTGSFRRSSSQVVTARSITVTRDIFSAELFPSFTPSLVSFCKKDKVKTAWIYALSHYVSSWWFLAASCAGISVIEPKAFNWLISLIKLLISDHFDKWSIFKLTVKQKWVSWASIMCCISNQNGIFGVSFRGGFIDRSSLRACVCACCSVEVIWSCRGL